MVDDDDAQRALGRVPEAVRRSGQEATLEAAIAEAAERLRVWHHQVRVTPRFRTPLERELSA
jgi:hypothetical protein